MGPIWQHDVLFLNKGKIDERIERKWPDPVSVGPDGKLQLKTWAIEAGKYSIHASNVIMRQGLVSEAETKLEVATAWGFFLFLECTSWVFWYDYNEPVYAAWLKAQSLYGKLKRRLGK